MNIKNKNNFSLIALLCGASLMPNIAQGQGVLEEIIVTAQKRAQSVNDIGVSATAIDGDQLNSLGIDEPSDLGAHTPGLVTVNSTSGGTTIFAIRGIGLDDFSPNNTSGVGVYTDEVFASNPAFLSGQLFDVKRIEVLKGPQGTLFGKNTTGGAISIVSNKPTEETEGYIEASYGRFNELEVTGAISGALSDNVQGRIAVQNTTSDGWQTDVNTGREFADQDRFAVRGLLNFDISDTTSALVRAYHSSDTSTPVSPEVDGLGDFFGDDAFNGLNSPVSSRLVSVGDLNVGRDESGQGISLTVNHSFENFDLISITAIDEYERVVVDNYGGSAAAILDLFQDDKLDQWSQEFRLVSNNDSNFSWIVGANFSGEEVDVLDSFDDSYLVTDSGGLGLFDPADTSAQGFDLLTADYVQETDSFGVYLHTETVLSDSLKVIAGLRYSDDERSFVGVSTNSDAELSFNDEIVSLNDSRSEDAFTGKLGLEWIANDDTLLYGSISNSYKSGAYYGAAVLDDISWGYVEPEDVVSIEAGFKATLLDNTLQINGSIFSLDYKDRQSLVTIIVDDFSNFLEVPIADTTLINVPESTSQGFELELDWAPTENLFIRAGIAYLDTEVTRAPTTAEARGINIDSSVNDFSDGVTVSFVDALAAPLTNGSVLAQSPEWSFNTLVRYELPIGDTRLFGLQTSFSRSDAMVAQLADANALSGTVESWNAEAYLSDIDGQWKVSLWAKNIADNDAETYSFSSFAGRAFYRQQPRTYGIRAKYEF